MSVVRLQTSPNWMLGVETDFQGASQRDSSNCRGGCTAYSMSVAKGETIGLGNLIIERFSRAYVAWRYPAAHATSLILASLTGVAARSN
jgi:hypothetical protein